MTIRKVEVWRKIKEFNYKSETSWMKGFRTLRDNHNGDNDYKIKRVKIKTPETDENLTGIDKESFKYKEEQPKVSKEERLRLFKLKEKENEK